MPPFVHLLVDAERLGATRMLGDDGLALLGVVPKLLFLGPARLVEELGVAVGATFDRGTDGAGESRKARLVPVLPDGL
jgi:hypothetical protein